MICRCAHRIGLLSAMRHDAERTVESVMVALVQRNSAVLSPGFWFVADPGVLDRLLLCQQVALEQKPPDGGAARK